MRLVLRLELGHDGRDDRRVEVVERQAAQLEQVRERGAELVRRRRAHGGEAPVLDELARPRKVPKCVCVLPTSTSEEHRGRIPTFRTMHGWRITKTATGIAATGPPDVPPARERAAQRVARLRGDAAAGRRPRRPRHRRLVLDRPGRGRGGMPRRSPWRTWTRRSVGCAQGLRERFPPDPNAPRARRT